MSKNQSKNTGGDILKYLKEGSFALDTSRNFVITPPIYLLQGNLFLLDMLYWPNSIIMFQYSCCGSWIFFIWKRIGTEHLPG